MEIRNLPYKQSMEYHGEQLLDPGERTLIWTNGFPGVLGVAIVGTEAAIDVTSSANTDKVKVNGVSFEKGVAPKWVDAATLAALINALPNVSATAAGSVVTAIAAAGKYLVVEKTEVAGTISIVMSQVADFMISSVTDSQEDIKADMFIARDMENTDYSVDTAIDCKTGMSAYLVRNDDDSDEPIKVTWRLIKP